MTSALDGEITTAPPRGEPSDELNIRAIAR